MAAYFHVDTAMEPRHATRREGPPVVSLVALRKAGLWGRRGQAAKRIVFGYLKRLPLAAAPLAVECKVRAKIND